MAIFQEPLFLSTIDGTTSGFPTTILVSNNTLLDKGARTFQITTGGGGAGSPPGGNPAVATKAANYTVQLTDAVIIGDATTAAFTLTLPTAVGNTGQTYRIKKKDATVNAVLVQPIASETIDGTTQAIIAAQYDSLDAISDGSNWYIF